MRSRSFLAPLVCLGSWFCLCSPAPARAAPEPAEATFWIRGVQQLYFAPESGRREFAATLGLSLPWELLFAQAAPPPAPGESPVQDAGTPQAADAAAEPAAPPAKPAAAATPAVVAPERTAPKPTLTPRLVRATLTRAYRAQGADEAESRLESLDVRSRWSAVLPELRLRAARATDESERLAPTIDDPYRYTRDGGTDLAFEVRLTWRLSGLLFNAPQVSIERIRSERAQRRAELRREVLKLLFTWQRARFVAEDTGALDEERHEAALTQLEAELTLNALTAGWFNEQRLEEVEQGPQ